MVEKGLPYRFVCCSFVIKHLVPVLLSFCFAYLRSAIDFVGAERPRFGYMGCLGSSQRSSRICIIGRQDEGKNACLRNDVKVCLCVVGCTGIVIVHKKADQPYNC
jgi:hypothetical protein